MSKIRVLHPEARLTEFAVKLRQQNALAADLEKREDAHDAAAVLAAKRLPLATVGDVFGAALDAAVAKEAAK